LSAARPVRTSCNFLQQRNRLGVSVADFVTEADQAVELPTVAQDPPTKAEASGKPSAKNKPTKGKRRGSKGASRPTT
jgi:hypothetical protein